VIDRSHRERALRILAPLIVAIVVIAVWQALVVVEDVPAYLVPSPALVAQTLYADRVLLLDSLAVTMQIALVALALATVLGVATGFCASAVSRLPKSPRAAKVRNPVTRLIVSKVVLHTIDRT